MRVGPNLPHRRPMPTRQWSEEADHGADLLMYIQPIVDLATGEPVAVEALARFPFASVSSTTGDVFAAAHASGRGRDLEAACIRAARALRPTLPDTLLLAINVSPDALSHAAVEDALGGDLTGVIVEITEHQSANPDDVTNRLFDLRGRGALLAVDDVSTGYAGLTRLAALNPDIIKLDRNLVTGIRNSRPNLAVIEALVSLARRLGGLVLAEGVESVDDLTALPDLDVDYAQGWAVSPPARQLEPIPTAIVDACRASRANLLGVGPVRLTETSAATRIAGMHHATAALARSDRHAEFESALADAARTLGLDSIGVSVLTDERTIHEIAATGAAIDPTPYLLSDYPATEAALREATMMEIQTERADTDRAERLLLVRHGMSSLLLVPLIVDQVPLGILELSHRRPHRWTNRDITHARGLAEHVGNTLLRLG
ncbi:MAG: EAL domain-containing protein [Jatrophihabitantaceae bacterium]